MAKSKGLRNAFYLRGTVTKVETFSAKVARAVIGSKFTLLLDNGDSLVLSVLNARLPTPPARVGDAVYASGTIKVFKPREDKDGFVQLNVTDFRVMDRDLPKPAKPNPTPVEQPEDEDPAPLDFEDDGDMPWGE